MKSLLVHTGVQGKYLWLVTRDFDIHTLIKKCPEVLLRKYLVISAFDSGPLAPNEEEIKAGWTVHGDTMCSPRLASLDGLPYDLYDEWYVFPEAHFIENHEIFVNHGGFSLRNPAYMLENLDSAWDVAGIKHQIEKEKEIQQRFWLQIERIFPESYIANGDNFIFVTRNKQLFDSAKHTLANEATI